MHLPKGEGEELGPSGGCRGWVRPGGHSHVEALNVNSLKRQKSVNMRTDAQITGDLRTKQMTENLIAIVKYG